MSESPTGRAKARYLPAVMVGVAVAVVLAGIGIGILAASPPEPGPTRTLPTGETISESLGTAVAQAGRSSRSAYALALSPDGRSVYALGYAELVRYDAETLARTGAIELPVEDPTLDNTVVISATGSVMVCLGETGELVAVSLDPSDFGAVLARTSQVPWGYSGQDGSLQLGVASDASAVYVLDTDSGQLWQMPMGDSGFAEPHSIWLPTVGGREGENGSAQLAVNPANGRVYLMNASHLLRVYEPDGLTLLTEATISDDEGRPLIALSEDGSLLFVVHFSRSDRLGNTLDTRNAETLALVSRVQGIYETRDGSAVVLTPTHNLVMANAQVESMVLVDVEAGRIIESLPSVSYNMGWIVGTDFHHLYYLSDGPDPNSDRWDAPFYPSAYTINGGLRRFDVSAVPPELMRHPARGVWFVAIALAVGILAVRQPAWRPFRASSAPSPTEEEAGLHPSGLGAIRSDRPRAGVGAPVESRRAKWQERAKAIGVAGAASILWPTQLLALLPGPIGGGEVSGLDDYPFAFWTRGALAVALAVAAARARKVWILVIASACLVAWLVGVATLTPSAGTVGLELRTDVFVMTVAGLALALVSFFLTPRFPASPAPPHAQRMNDATLDALFLWVVPVLGVILGHRALRRLHRGGDVSAGVTMAALIGAYVVTAIWVFFAGVFALASAFAVE
jgi:DNA-binding beta-propeller fold protein YncE